MIKYLRCTDTDIKILKIVSITDQLCYKNTSIAHSSKYFKHHKSKIATIIISQQNRKKNVRNERPTDTTQEQVGRPHTHTHTITIEKMHERPTDVNQEQVGRPHTHITSKTINEMMYMECDASQKLSFEERSKMKFG